MIEVGGEAFESIVQMESIAKARRRSAQAHRDLAGRLEEAAQTLERAIEAEKSKPQAGDIFFNKDNNRVAVITEYKGWGLVFWEVDNTGKAYWSSASNMGAGWKKVTQGGGPGTIGDLVRESLKGDKNV